MQPQPHATVYHGGAGVAYALWRAGQRRQAGRWLGDALADRRSAAFAWEYAAPATSYHYGRAGLHWVHALTGDRVAVSRYLRLAQRGRGIEFMDGAAGHLTGARLLLGRHDDRRLRRVGATLAARLRRRLRARGARPWRAGDAAGGFAHDWTGVFHALLEWSRARGEGPPPWLLESLQRLAAIWSPQKVRRPALAGAWCQGAAGALLLWCSAYATTNHPPFLRCAREAGRIALAAEYATPGLCCGSAGAAFGLLELDRIDPEHGWRQGARELGLRAVQASGLRWPYGLLRGHSGLVCLALDLVAERPVGFPTIFGSETRPRGLVS
jgi:hypothetical protein